MKTRLLNVAAPLLSCLLVVATCQVAAAFTFFGEDCLACHSLPAGSMAIIPDPIEIEIGDNGLITFEINALPGAMSAISVSGLDNMDLDAMIGAGGDQWIWTVGSSGSSYISDIITTPGPYTLDLGIGAAAVEGLYLIEASLVGNSLTGSSYDSNLIVVSGSDVTGVESGDRVIRVVRLLPNRPNPFNPQTTISIELPGAARAEILVFNMSGQLVKNLWTGDLTSGPHSFVWTGADNQGNAVPSGSYFYRLRTGDFTDTNRMVLIR